jgi:hypothetical protein
VFLVEEKRHGATHLVFTWENPRKAGYQGAVVENVTLDYDMDSVHTWPDGQTRPDACVGRAPDNPNRFKVFKYCADRQAAGYLPVAGTAVVFGSWRDYVALHLLPPDPDQTPAESWFDYLDRLDEDSRRRRQRVHAPDPPTNGSRDEIAAWLAKKHFLVDTSIREVWYLPGGSPPEEIRLLELNDRFTGAAMNDPIDFGLDLEGARFRLVVADINSDRLDQIKQDPSRLPPGWSLDGKKIWRRGA